MVASLSCTAEGLHWLWVLHSAIEKTMLKQARDNINALISFFQKEVSSGALTAQPQQREATQTQASLFSPHTCTAALDGLRKGCTSCDDGESGYLPTRQEASQCAICVSCMEAGVMSYPRSWVPLHNESPMLNWSLPD